MGNNTRMRIVILFIFSLSLVSFNAYSLGISSPYLENNTLLLPKGQSTIYTIILQNPEDIDIEVRLNYDSKIAKIIDYKEAYILPAGKLDTKISFNITASKDTKPGDIYPVSYSIKPLSSTGGGTLPMIVGMNKQFNVELLKADENARSYFSPTSYYLIFIASAMTLLVILTILIIRSLKIKKPKRTKGTN